MPFLGKIVKINDILYIEYEDLGHLQKRKLSTDRLNKIKEEDYLGKKTYFKFVYEVNTGKLFCDFDYQSIRYFKLRELLN
jgi:hypothetical protein